MRPLVRQRGLAAGVGPDVHLCEYVVLRIWSLFGQEEPPTRQLAVAPQSWSCEHIRVWLDHREFWAV